MTTKKIYTAPAVEVLTFMSEEDMLIGSGVSNSEKALEYGGVDVEGTKEAASRVIMIDVFFGD